VDGSCKVDGKGEGNIKGDGPTKVSAGTPPKPTTSAPTPTKIPAVEEEAPKKEKGKGKGKDSKPPPPIMKPPPPKASVKGPPGKLQLQSKRIAPPFGRRLDWQPLSKDKAIGTVFEGLRGDVDVDAVCLRNLFEKAKDKEAPRQEPKSAPKAVSQVALLSGHRAQNMLIALRRQPLTHAVLEAMKELDYQAEALGPEVCSVLIGAVPTAEESKQLLGFPGETSTLREIERLVLPLAKLERPPVGQRLRLLLFGGSMRDLIAEVQGSLLLVRRGLESVRQSNALRSVLRHTMCLGSVLNFGEVDVEDDGCVGFTLDSLPKLALCKATNNVRLTLLHVLVAQVTVADEALPKALMDELACTKEPARLSLVQLAESVSAFHREASHASACSQARGASAPEADDGATVHLAALAKQSLAEAASLEAELVSTREAARKTLAFFASPFRPQEVDTKVLDLMSVLSEFAGSFKRCAQELEAHPEVARMCHRGMGKPA